ncbi:MAG: hypothetical protein QNL90_20180 [Gammaproteobacteria bacterium]|nr:hypothetical protein [Gammaproteobacteria bacterium]
MSNFLLVLTTLLMAFATACGDDDSTATPADPTPVEDSICELSGDCKFDCEPGECAHACESDATCTISCAGGGCDLQCRDQAQCAFACAAGAACAFSCAGGDCTGDFTDNPNNSTNNVTNNPTNNATNNPTNNIVPDQCQTSFGEVSACGGAAAGSWSVVDGCARLDTAGFRNACRSAQVGQLEHTSSGTLNLQSDGTFTKNGSNEVSVDMVVLPDCVMVLGQCSQVEVFIEDQQPWLESACNPRAGGCDCAVNNSIADNTSGTWTASGNALTLTSGGSSESYFYCVDGGFLTMRPSGDADDRSYFTEIFERL